MYKKKQKDDLAPSWTASSLKKTFQPTMLIETCNELMIYGFGLLPC